MRISAPVVVVPNPTLAGNHQEEFAEKFEAMGYVVYGKLE
jgi:UDP-N-acetylglucosamine transferase subunit ALG13